MFWQFGSGETRHLARAHVLLFALEVSRPEIKHVEAVVTRVAAKIVPSDGDLAHVERLTLRAGAADRHVRWPGSSKHVCRPGG